MGRRSDPVVPVGAAVNVFSNVPFPTFEELTLRRPTRLWIAFACAVVCGSIGAATFLLRPDSTTYTTRLTSLMRLSVPRVPCLVEPLAPIVDAEAAAFENGIGGIAPGVDTADLTSGTARALARFEHVVTTAGGTLTITSAYRPPAYQQHLQAVWDKWMNELRDNHEQQCEELRTRVGREFAHHRLLETQRPVNVSDHTRGLAFDAAVVLPKAARPRARVVSLDRLARLCSLRRPDVLHDPVHFRLASARRGRSV